MRNWCRDGGGTTAGAGVATVAVTHVGFGADAGGTTDAIAVTTWRCGAGPPCASWQGNIGDAMGMPGVPGITTVAVGTSRGNARGGTTAGDRARTATQGTAIWRWRVGCCTPAASARPTPDATLQAGGAGDGACCRQGTFGTNETNFGALASGDVTGHAKCEVFSDCVRHIIRGVAGALECGRGPRNDGVPVTNTGDDCTVARHTGDRRGVCICGIGVRPSRGVRSGERQTVRGEIIGCSCGTPNAAGADNRGAVSVRALIERLITSRFGVNPSKPTSQLCVRIVATDDAFDCVEYIRCGCIVERVSKNCASPRESLRLSGTVERTGLLM